MGTGVSNMVCLMATFKIVDVGAKPSEKQTSRLRLDFLLFELGPPIILLHSEINKFAK